MSRYIATRAIRGATAMVAEAEAAVSAALAELGPDAPVQFTNTAYYLPVIYAFTGQKVETLGELPPIIARAKALLHPLPRRHDVAALPGRDAGFGRRHAVRRGGHGGRALRARGRAADHQARPATTRTRSASAPSAPWCTATR